jgi:hypothetical protein
MKNSPNGYVRTRQFWHTRVMCPHCQQPMPEMRLDVRFPPLKAAIFDLIKRAGGHGMTQQELQGTFEIGTLYTVRAHIWGINELIEDTGWRIRGGTRHAPGYRLVKIEKTTVSPLPTRIRPPRVPHNIEACRFIRADDEQ